MLACGTFGQAWQIKTDNCIMKVNPANPVFYKDVNPSDDKRHFGVYFRKGVRKFMRVAILSAMGKWNARSDETRVVFEETSEAVADIKVQFGAFQKSEIKSECGKELSSEARKVCRAARESEDNKACALYDTRRRVVWYMKSNDWKKWNEIDTQAVVRLFSHELGHVMNLDHKFDDYTIMREGDLSKDCGTIAAKILSEIQDADVADAKECADLSHLKTQQH
jgi:hypothetical protein